MPEASKPARPNRAEPPPGSVLDARYEVYGEIGSGGMASVQYGRLVGPRGFSRAVAIKRLHPHFAREQEFVSMFVDEARLSARLVHANIIPTLDVVETPGEIALIMEYVHGESLWGLLQLARQREQAVPVRVASGLLASVLYGLHAAHETRDEHGSSLGIVHRDVSPQNILVGRDGIPRVLDFGIAKAVGRLRSTPSGEIKGKLAYIAPEQLRGAKVDRRVDVYGASAVLWETLTGQPLFDRPSESALVHDVLHALVAPPSSLRAEIPEVLDGIVLRGLSRDVPTRFDTAREMAVLLEREVGIASQSEISDWLQDLAGELLDRRAVELQEMQRRAQERGAQQIATPQAVAVSTRRIDVEGEASAPAAALPERGAHESGAHESGPRAKRREPAWATLAAMIAVLGAISAVFLWTRGPREQAQPNENDVSAVHRGSAATGIRTTVQEERSDEAASAVNEANEAARATSAQLVGVEGQPLVAPVAAEPALAGSVTKPDGPAAGSGADPATDATDPRSSTKARAATDREARRAQRAKVMAARAAAAAREGKADLTEPSEPASGVVKQSSGPAKPSPDTKCTPYFYIDRDGIRRPKPWCL